ncbi:MAG: FAD/NAD(P)-binding protein [Candidatus Tumulicola sp.]
MDAEASKFDVAIVGAGFCGAMLATYLSEDPLLRTALFEKDTFARGVAYASESPRHLLNLTAANMSAFPDKPNDFVEWIGNVSPTEFLPRSQYAEYLRCIFDCTMQGASNVSRFKDSIDSVTPDSGGFRVGAPGLSLWARRVVLAIGIFKPADDFVDEVIRGAPHYVGDPWSVPYDDLSGDVLTIGSGLTAIDVLAELHHRGYQHNVTILSRHGLSPQTHKPYGGAVESLLEARTALSMLRSVRKAIDAQERAGGDWRAVVDGIRPLTQRIWQSWPLRERERFLRHLRVYWETSRRRVPAAAANAVSALESSGRLRRVVGRIQAIDQSKSGRFHVLIERAGNATSFDTDWIINCTGPQSDVSKIDDKLIKSLLRQSLIRPHPTGIGIDATTDGCIVDANGVPNDSLFALGSLLRGVLYESVSVPELRLQVKALAQRITSQVGYAGGP